jgi:predicted phage terminase large subunit-like protein
VLGQDLLVEPALAEKGLPTAWFAPTYRMMLDTFREVADTLRPVASKINASDHRIELVTGGVIDMWSLDVPDVARGRKYKRVIINEAAMVPELARTFQNVIRPTLADYKGDAWFLSTPKGYNDFHNLYQRELTNNDWRSWTYATSANPYIPESEIEAMRRDMSDAAFRQEILAEFVAIEGALFQRDMFKVVDRAPEGLKWLRTYDLALTVKEASDRTASLCGAQDDEPCVCCGVANPVYIRDGLAFKAEYPEVKKKMIAQGVVDGRNVHIAVETVAFQLAAVQELRLVPELFGYTIIAEKPIGDKISRLRPAQGRAEQGQIHLVRGAWINDFLNEITSITAEMDQEHDDYGDALSSLIKRLPEPMRLQRLPKNRDRNDWVFAEE